MLGLAALLRLAGPVHALSTIRTLLSVEHLCMPLSACCVHNCDYAVSACVFQAPAVRGDASISSGTEDVSYSLSLRQQPAYC
jgi:hypothetical protein